MLFLSQNQSPFSIHVIRYLVSISDVDFILIFTNANGKVKLAQPLCFKVSLVVL